MKLKVNDKITYFSTPNGGRNQTFRISAVVVGFTEFRVKIRTIEDQKERIRTVSLETLSPRTTEDIVDGLLVT